MKIEKLMKRKYIKTSIIVLVVISIMGVIFINRSKAKYRVTQSIQVVNGTVNYKPADFSLISINLQESKDSSNYISSEKVPTTGYKLNEDKTYCTINGTKYEGKNAYNGQGIKITYSDTMNFNGINKANTKCYLYFDVRELLIDKLGIKVNGTNEGCPAYEDAPSITTIEDKKSLLCKGIDDFGDTYYYRGAVLNNWVKLGNIYWRIIRFNGNSTIRLIYSGTKTPATTGDETQIEKSAFNNNFNGSQYAKYMYGTNTSSTIKSVLDSWYNTNLKKYVDILDGKSGFCNDADDGYATDYQYYFKPYDRIVTDKKPTFKCGTPTENLFTTSDGTYGNQKLDYAIGLITADEASFAGAAGYERNTYYYLYTGNGYWTMSSYGYTTNIGNHSNVFIINSTGYLNSRSVQEKYDGIRPVINLKADTEFKEGGDGTSTNPYEVVI